jgi:hypothetical protein
MSRLVIYAAMLVPQLLNLNQAAFGQSRLRVVRQNHAK